MARLWGVFCSSFVTTCQEWLLLFGETLSVLSADPVKSFKVYVTTESSIDCSD